MPEQEARALLESAMRAGAARDYRKAAELLTLLLSQTDSLPEAYVYLGRARYALGEQGRAIEAFRRYLRVGGDRAAGLFFLGRSYLACGRAEDAARCLRRSAAADPNKAPIWALLGAAALKLRKTKAAVDCLERAVGLAPQDKRVYRGYLNAMYARGVRLLSRGNADMARQVLGFAVDNGLDGAAIRLWRAKALRETGRIKEALVECEAALAQAPGDPSIRWLRAGLLLAAGRQSEALGEFDSIRALHPDLPALPADDVSLARLRASVAFREGRYKQAVSDSMPLLRANPKDAALRSIAAESLRAIGELERSRNHWLRAVEAAPEEPEFRLGLALALYDLGDYEASLAAAERARKLGADAAEVDYYATLCRSRLGEDPAKLIPALQALIRSRSSAQSGSDESRSPVPADPRLFFALGEALYRSGRPDLASGWFEKVLFLVPDHELSLLYRISAAESLGEEEARGEAYAAYLEAYPDNQKLRREYVSALVGLGNWSAAAAQLESSLPYGAPDERARRLLAVAYRNAGRYREAAVAYRDLLREEPGSGELLLGLSYCLERDGKAEYALALLEKAPAAAKARAAPWIMQAALYARGGRDEAAVVALRSAIDRDRANEKAWKSLVALYRKRGLSELAANCEEEWRSATAAAARTSPAARTSSTAKAAASAAASAAAPPKPLSKKARDAAPPKAEAKADRRDTSKARGRAFGDAKGRGEASSLADLDVRSRRRDG
jgi:tetratricopeptide (TPR) repeat protein